MVYSSFASRFHTPWAKSFWAFSPYLNRMRKFSQKNYRITPRLNLNSIGLTPCFRLNAVQKWLW